MTTTSPFHFEQAAPLAYNLSRWERLLFDGRLASSAALAGQVREVERQIEAKTPDTSRDDSTTFAAEIFGRLYNDPSAIEGATGWAPAAHKISQELPEWEALRGAVRGDPDFSALATCEVLAAVAPRLPALLEEAKKDQAGEDDRATSEQMGKAGQQVRAALRRACEQAVQQVADAREAMEGIAPGSAFAPPTHEQKDTRRLALAEQLLRQPRLRDVLRRAGRLVRLAERAELARDPKAVGVVVGVEQGADIARVLPASLAMLGHPLLKLLTFKGIADRTLPQYRMEGKTPQGKGPLVVLMDESSSMEGAGELWAHAAVLACIAIGAKEGREVAVVLFNHRVSSAWVAQPDGEVLALSTSSPTAAPSRTWGKRVDLAMELCTRRSDGGTDFGAPIRWGMDYLEAGHPRSDLIFITDGQASASPATMERIVAARAAGLRIFGLTVNGGSISSEVAAICTSTVDIDRAEKADSAIAQALPVRR